MQLRLLPDLFGVLKLSPSQSFPTWLEGVSPFFLARTDDEYSIMCPQRHIPENLSYHADYHCLRVEDVAFDEIGVVARVSAPLAQAGLAIFLVSTHDRDYVLVQQNDLQTALTAYHDAGLRVLT